MRTSTLVFTAILSATVFAHPFNIHQRDGASKSQPKLKNEYVKDHTLFKEYEVVVVGGQQQQQPAKVQDTTPAQPASSPKADAVETPQKPEVQQKQQKPQQHSEHHEWHQVTQQQQPQQDKVQQKQVQQQPQQQHEQPKETPKVTPTESTPEKPKETKEPAKTDSSKAGTCKEDDTIGGSASNWAGTPCSGGKPIIDTINQMRGQWDSSLSSSPYQWSDKLAANAFKTDDVDCGKGSSMKHNLYSGSMGQCIAEHINGPSSGGLSSIGNALQMWMCEMKQGPFCDKQTAGIGPDSQGHAKIFKSQSYSHIGCAFMNQGGSANAARGMWVCDFGSA